MSKQKKIRVLAISYLFPNSVYPNYGIFVLNRLRYIGKYCDVKVINPIPWFPLSSKLSRYKNYNLIPRREVIAGIEIFHPRFFIIPGTLKFLDSISFCMAVLPLALCLRKVYPFDIIDLHWTYPDILSGRLLSKLTRKKQLVTVRGPEALYLKEKSLRKAILNVLLRRSDFVITLSNELRELCIKRRVATTSIAVIRNGVDTRLFSLLDKQMCRKSLGLSKSKRIILSVGSLIFRKGFDRIIKILPEVLRRFPDAEYYIVGSKGPEGDYRSNLYSLIDRLNLAPKVRFVGQVKNEDLVLWYNAADVFCLASRGEGSPNVLTEALSCGCPSVATDVGSVSEILVKDFMGVVVPNNDKSILPGLLRALSTEYKRQKISQNMREFDWDWCAKKVVKIYSNILSEY